MAGPTDEQAPPAAASPDEQRPRFSARIREQRLAKLDALAERGMARYPARFERDHTLAEVRTEAGDLAAGSTTGTTVRVAARVLSVRDHGGVVFCDVRDVSGPLQLLASRDAAPDDALTTLRALDRGDWIGVAGEVVASRSGELSVAVQEIAILSKALRVVPATQLANVETRFRQRYLDLIVNERARRMFEIRHATIAAIRRTLHERGFVEVETPVLEGQAGGAAARPFETYHHALDLDMVLRIALELPLKRLVVGGMERVFELGRVFRNEGLSPRHNPEFTMLEAYQAFADYREMMDLTEALFVAAAKAALGTTVVTIEGREVDLATSWRRATMAELISEHSGHEMHPSMPIDDARAIARDVGVEVNPAWGPGAIMAEVFEAVAEEQMIEPTFVCDYPREISPLAKSSPDDPEITERFELFVGARELANAYSELNDPVDQRERLEAQARQHAAGDDEASEVDEDFLRALEYGLPPTGGLGIGIDRLVMLLANASTIREVILFPTMRPEVDDPVARKRRGRSRMAGPAPAPAPAVAAEAGVEGGHLDRGTATEEELLAAAEVVEARRARRSARRIAWLVAFMALLLVLPFIPLARGGDGEVVTGVTRPVAAIGTAVIGLVLIFLARRLARRQRAAWIATLVGVVAGGIVSALHDPLSLEALLCLFTVVVLIWRRNVFTAPTDPQASAALIRFVPAYLLAIGVIGTLMLLFENDRVANELTVGGVLEQVYGGLLGFEGPYRLRSELLSDFFDVGLLILGVIGLVIALVLAFRPLVQGSGQDRDRERAHELVRRYGRDTLAYFALRDDRNYFFSSDGNAMISYAVVRGHALASGDPIGDPASVPRVLAEFIAHCRKHAWRIAFLAAREADLPLYHSHGMRSVYLGDEAVIPCAEFTLNGREMRNLRNTVTRIKRDHRVELMPENEASPALVEQLNEISRHWRGEDPERGFTMALGRDVEGTDEELMLAIARDANERVVAFLRLVPVYGEHPGYSLDLMRREPNSVNGATEFLIAMTALQLGELGYERLSMNFAPWGRLFEDDVGLSTFDRVLKWFATALNPLFQIQSLKTFNDKFAPDWVSRIIVVEDTRSLARVGVLYASAEGQIDLPIIGRLLVPETRIASETPASAAGGTPAAT